MLRAVGVADVLEADFLAVGQSLLAGRGDVQRGRLQQRLHALAALAAPPRSCSSVCSSSIGAQMPGATSAKGSTSSGVIQPRCAYSRPNASTRPSTVTGAIIAWAWAMVPTSGRAKAAKARAKPSTASR